MSETPEQPQEPAPVEILPPPGRDLRGAFAKGNKHGRGGDPMAGRRQKFRVAFLKELTTGDIRQITKWLIQEAKGGNMDAIKELLDRAMPKEKGGETNVNVNVTQNTHAVLEVIREDPDSQKLVEKIAARFDPLK